MPLPFSRRRALGWLTALAAAPAFPGHGLAAGSDLEPALWQAFARRFISNEGRVIDTGNGGISHSEGQGYGMVLAAAARDRAGFERIWSWTRANLLVRSDELAAWKWVPGKEVIDRNNATDGDLLIAWALYTAGKRWENRFYIEAGKVIARTIRDQLLVRKGEFTLLLPGAEGFRRGESVVVNPSYLIFPAFRAFEEADPSGPWPELSRSALALLAKARMGTVQLPPDWLLVGPDGSVSLPEGFKAQYGYDSVRVPLYLAWGGIDDPYYFRPFALLATRAAAGGVPATVSLPGGVTGQVAAATGMLAVYRLSSVLAGSGSAVAVPRPAPDEDYYSSVLFLLARVAMRGLGIDP